MSEWTPTTAVTSMPERTFWRDDHNLAAWHAHHGLFYLANAGVGLLMIEYDHGTPKAIVEYRPYASGMPDIRTLPYRLIAAVAGNLPFIICCYTETGSDDALALYARPANHAAQFWLFNAGWAGTERRWVDLLHRIRDNAPWEHVADNLGDQVPLYAPGSATPQSRPLVDLMSLRHRKYGRRARVVDLDCLLPNVAQTPAALIEYKKQGADLREGSNTIALQRLAAMRGLQFVMVEYWRPEDDATRFNEWRFRRCVRGQPREGFVSADRFARFLWRMAGVVGA